MDLIFQLSEWARTMLSMAGTSQLTLPFAFLLGLASAVASTCCSLPVFGAVVGYAGMRESMDRRSNMMAAMFFMIGVIISLLIIGSVAGFIGQVAQTVLGSYWKIFAGIVAIMSFVARTPYAPMPNDLVQFFAHERMASTCMHCMGISFGQISIWLETILSR